MKIKTINQNNCGLTLTEVLVIVVALFLLAIFFLPIIAEHNRPLRIECVSNLKETGLAYRLWANDHGGKFPMEVSVADGGTMGLGEGRNAWINFLVMSNILNTPKILYCPADKDHFYATNFGIEFNEANVSYFVGLDAANTNSPTSILSGDDNFENGNIPIMPGLLKFSTNNPVEWTAKRHIHGGNVGFADGSVQELTANGWHTALVETGFATNRLAIP